MKFETCTRNGVAVRLVMAFACWFGCGDSAVAQISPYRAGAHTLFEALNLSTPEHAASAFLDAWARSDYGVVHMILSPAAQHAWYLRYMTTFHLDMFSSREECVVEHSVFAKDNPEWTETLNDPNQIFASFVSASQICGTLPFVVNEPVSLKLGAHDDLQTVVEVTTGSYPAPMRLHLVHLSSGRWKVDQLDMPGADPAKKPWGFTIAK